MMLRLVLASFVASASAANHWPWDRAADDKPAAKPAVDVSTDDDSEKQAAKDSGDFMDRYIKDSGMKPVADDTTPSFHAIKSDDSAEGTEHKKSAYPWEAEMAAAESRSEKPPQNSDADAQPAVQRNAVLDGPTQVESSNSGASQTDAVVSVRLSSELQQSFLQARDAELKHLQHSHTAPNVEDEVAKERMADVYIHDGFGKEEQADAKVVKEVKANKDLKP